MRRMALATLAGCMILVPAARAQFNAGNIYLQGGFSYVMPSIDGMSEVQNAIGYTATAGYQINEHVSVALDLLMIPKIENDAEAVFTEYESRYYYYARLELPLIEASAMGFFASVKYQFNPLANMNGLVPYLSAGLGNMKFKAEKYAPIPPEAQHVDWDEEDFDVDMDSISGMCIRIGGGATYFFSPTLSVSGDLSYLQGNGDIDGYTHVAVSGVVGYHFP